jgi:hypothetical protein
VVGGIADYEFENDDHAIESTTALYSREIIERSSYPVSEASVIATAKSGFPELSAAPRRFIGRRPDTPGRLRARAGLVFRGSRAAALRGDAAACLSKHRSAKTELELGNW